MRDDPKGLRPLDYSGEASKLEPTRHALRHSLGRATRDIADVMKELAVALQNSVELPVEFGGVKLTGQREHRRIVNTSRKGRAFERLDDVE
jgi:hypothetical protein